MSNRLKFFLSHLSISILIALFVMGLVFFIWYPTPLAKAVGVTQIFLMMLAIDVIVGPLLGLFVYKKGKKSLKFDLIVIIAIQISALLYGIYSIEQGRPAWIVFNVDRFELVRKNEIVDQNINQAKPQFQQVSWFRPQFVAMQFANNTQQHNDDMFAEVLGGISLAQRPERYVNFAEAKAQLQKRAQSLELLQQYNDKAVVKNILAKYPQATAFLPMKASAVDMTVLINKQGEVAKIVDLRPW
ncbi:type IV pilin accessory protein [Acinetobacter sp. TTH0-4]|uniref:TfpX/TfpZ family type IV pilin accessory protein n=1 Tax=Acinetobacter sp. TTH0-4 TaxID=1646498 RepID=UPI0018A026CB|nr:TfpX/TfpZ family type IV pilin accessory protein [Acinetobacter sp. TTH0-4]QPF38217.1 type IV pilin accessory protein [Acinetobacter sp. TTH0-4]